jgi:hypothetical protein
MCQHTGEKDMPARPERRDPNSLALQVAERADALGAEQLEASNVNAGEQRQLVAGVDPGDEGRHRCDAKVGLASSDGVDAIDAGLFYGMDICEALALEQLLGDDQGRSRAYLGILDHANLVCLQRRLGGN